MARPASVSPCVRALALLITLTACRTATAGRLAPDLSSAASISVSGPGGSQQQQHDVHRRRDTECEKPEFRAGLLPLIKEMPLIGLFDDIKETTKFEASGMTIAPWGGREWLWIVFDNLHSLGRVDEHFEFRDKHNLLVGETGEESQFEGLTYVESTGRFIAVEEVYDSEHHGLVPFTHELELSKDGSHYHTISSCPVHFELEHENKGFEGLHYHDDGKGHQYLLGLCEGNFCAGSARGREAGNGRLVVAESNGVQGEGCGWNVIKVVHIPPQADFIDYSGIAFRGNRVAIISQENSAMWLGTFDFEALEFEPEGRVFNFPRDNHCKMIYCNVEGIQWIDDVRFAIASDKAKRTQPFRCISKEQRISIFALPQDPFSDVLAEEEAPAAAAATA